MMFGACQSTDVATPERTRSNLDGSVLPNYRSADALTPLREAPVTIRSGEVFEEATVTSQRRVPVLSSRGRGLAGGPAQSVPKFDKTRISVAVPPQPVPEFINTVMGEILQTGFTLGPGVAELPNIIALRTANDISKAELYETSVNALEAYGVAVYHVDGEVRAVLRDDLKQLAPRFIRSRARASVPGSLRPVVQFVELYALTPEDMASILRQAFPGKDRIKVEANRNASSVTLVGLPEAVDQAVAIINQMDELRFAGRPTATINVVNWDAKELSAALQSLLIAEGYAVSAQPGIFRPITIVSLEKTNQVVVFASTQNFLDHTVRTALDLDKAARPTPNERRARIYKARHYAASQLASVLDQVTQLIRASEVSAATPDAPVSRRARPTSTATTGAIGSDGLAGSVGSGGTGEFVVDDQGNRLVFMASESEYRETLQLLETLDTPAAEVLIEVTIAEVTLTDDTQSGLEFLVQQIGSTGFALGTRGGLSLASSGLSGTLQGDDYIVNFGLGSTNNAINVLSTPRVVTRSGAQASIQVGTDVPIITSQSAGLSQSIGGRTDILQSVEYRETGILLDVTPLVLSDDRIDLQISQEVSSAEANPNQAIGSPIISNRSITSELTLQDGQSAILGGLIENRYTQGQTGVPFLKDVPILGRLFSVDTLTERDTILLFMVTPYVLRGADDRADVLEPLVGEVNRAFSNQDEELLTLTPRETPLVLGTRNRADGR